MGLEIFNSFLFFVILRLGFDVSVDWHTFYVVGSISPLILFFLAEDGSCFVLIGCRRISPSVSALF